MKRLLLTAKHYVGTVHKLIHCGGRMKFVLITTTIILLITAGHVPTVVGQKRSERTPARPGKPAVSQPPARGSDARPQTDKYWAAQRSITAAIQQLEEYLRESPDGERAPTARQQLAVLRSLTETSSRPAWVSMSRRTLREVPEWRIASVESQADKTRLNIEVACRREDGGKCYFRPFDRFPLVLVDGAGRYYPMLKASDLPPDVRQREHDERFAVSGGRTITVTVDFAPLAGGAISGQVYYRDDNQAMPARFSLAPRH